MREWSRNLKMAVYVALLLTFIVGAACSTLATVVCLHLLNDHAHYHSDDILLHQPPRSAP